MITSVLLQLASSHPEAVEQLQQLANRARTETGAGPALTVRAVGAKATPLSRFPGDGVAFAALSAVLVGGVYFSFVYLVSTNMGAAPVARIGLAAIATLAAVMTFRLSTRRSMPKLDGVPLPSATTDQPAREVAAFADSAAEVLDRDAHRQLREIQIVYSIVAATSVWCGVLIASGHWRFAQLLLPATLLFTSFTWLNWKPLQTVRQKRKLATAARAIAAQLRTIHDAEWQRVHTAFAIVETGLPAR